MPDPTLPNSSGAPSGSEPNPNPGGSPGATPPSTTTATPASNAAPQRPAWASDDLWDGEKNSLREDALTARLKEAETLKTDIEARKAAIAADPKSYYKAELPDDVLKALPKDWEIKTDDPVWDQYREIAKATDLTQEQFKNLAGLKVKMDLAAAEENKAQIARHQESIHKALGDRGPEMVESVRTWMKGFFGPELGEQFQHALFTADMVKGFKRIQELLTSQGVTNFSQVGRTEGRTDGLPNNWEQMSPLDRRTYQLTHPAAGRA